MHYTFLVPIYVENKPSTITESCTNHAYFDLEYDPNHDTINKRQTKYLKYGQPWTNTLPTHQNIISKNNNSTFYRFEPIAEG